MSTGTRLHHDNARSMKITGAEYITSAAEISQCPGGSVPEIVLIGRSNVGKSSLINRFVNRKGLAKTSSAPGKTRTINFYMINERFYMVDLPGIGYARVPLEVRKSWERMIGGYFEARENIKGALVILDSRRDVGESELGIYAWLEGLGIAAGTILTKTDKLSQNKLAVRLAALKRVMPERDPVLFSALSGRGKAPLGRLIEEMLGPS